MTMVWNSQDYLAKEYYEQAASQGHSGSQQSGTSLSPWLWVSRVILKPRNIMSKPHTKVIWCQHNLGNLYLKGHGVSRLS